MSGYNFYTGIKINTLIEKIKEFKSLQCVIENVLYTMKISRHVTNIQEYSDEERINL